MMGFSVSPYPVAFVSSFIISFILVFVLLRKRGIPSNFIGYSLFLNVVMILSGAKMYSVITSGFRLNMLNSGISSLGGVIGLLAGVIIFGFIYREGRRVFLEVYVLVIPLMYGIAKIGCYLVGCCHGVPYDGLFAVSYNNQSMQGGPYFPIQLLETIVFMVIFGVGIRLYLSGKTSYVVSLNIILCAVAKFALEYLREEHIGRILSANQLVCIAFCLWGLIHILCFVRKEQAERAYPSK